MERMTPDTDNREGLGEGMYAKFVQNYEKLLEENKKLNEFKEKRKESRFYFKAQMERAEPKTAREAEDLQRAKELFEKLYREELSCLEEENKTLKDNVEFLHSCLDDRDKSIAIMQEENKKLNIKVASLEGEIKGLNYTIEKLHNEIKEQETEGHGLFDEIDYRKRECKKLREKVRFLEECLDRKEKLNEKYRKEIEKLKSTYVYDAKQVRDVC